VSVNSDGTQADGDSMRPALSADGRFVAFASYARLAGDTADHLDVFVHDRETHTTECVSLTADGKWANDDSDHPRISADGRYVSFWSVANNLLPGDTSVADIFVRDRRTGSLEKASVATGGAAANQWSYQGSLSANGRWVAFVSSATNLAPGGDAAASGQPSRNDVFLRDRQTGRTERITVGVDGRPSNGECGDPQLSADGRWLAFFSDATNLASVAQADCPNCPHVYLYDCQAREMRCLGALIGGTPGYIASGVGFLSLSADGRWLADGYCNPWLYDCRTGQSVQLDLSPDSNLPSGGGGDTSVSTGDRHVAFASSAYNLVPGDTNGVQDIFVWDRVSARIEQVSVSSAGTAITPPAPRVVEEPMAFPELAPAVQAAGFPLLVPDRVPGDLPLDSAWVWSDSGGRDTRLLYSAHCPPLDASCRMLDVRLTYNPGLAADTPLPPPAGKSQAQWDPRPVQVRGHAGYTWWEPAVAMGNAAVLSWREDHVTIELRLYGDWPEVGEKDPHALDDVLLQIAESLQAEPSG